MGAQRQIAIDKAKRGHHVALAVCLQGASYLREACEQLKITTPTALLQFVLEHPYLNWKKQLPRLLADDSLRAFWNGKTIDWFEQALRFVKYNAANTAAR